MIVQARHLKAVAALFATLCLCASISGCVEPKREQWAGPSDFPTLRVKVDGETRVVQVVTDEEIRLRQMVWDYAHSGDLAGARAGGYNVVRDEMQSRPYVAINSTDPVHLRDGDESVRTYFILVSLTQHEGRPDGIICDTIYCTVIGSPRSIENLTTAAHEYMSQ